MTYSRRLTPRQIVLQEQLAQLMLHALVLKADCVLQFGFNNGQTMVDGLYAGNTYQVGHSLIPVNGARSTPGLMLHTGNLGQEHCSKDCLLH